MKLQKHSIISCKEPVSILLTKLPWKGAIVPPTLLVIAVAITSVITGEGIELVAWLFIAWPLFIFIALVLLSPAMYFAIAKQTSSYAWKINLIFGMIFSIATGYALSINTTGWVLNITTWLASFHIAVASEQLFVKRGNRQTSNHPGSHKDAL